MSAPASEHAAAVAGQRLHVVEHGDNDPAATAELHTRVAVVDNLVPRLEHPDPGSPMCASWGAES